MPANEKQQKLIAKIERAKKDLLALQEKRKREIGSLACKHGLDCMDNETLNNAFANLAKELVHEPA